MNKEENKTVHMEHDPTSPFSMEELQKYIDDYVGEDNKSVEELLDSVDFTQYEKNYIPSKFALKFVNFIRLVTDNRGEQHKTPIMHYVLLDILANSNKPVANMIFRGAAKTTLFGEYLFLYIAFYGCLADESKKITFALYVGDTIENGVASMMKNLKHRFDESEFLNKYLVGTFTSTRWLFETREREPDTGKTRKFVVQGFGALTGIRGTKEFGQRPQLVILDDLYSDKVAKSPANLENIRNTVDKAVEYALDPDSQLIWNGTPFDQADPLYVAVGSGAYASNVFPVCNTFPCYREDFVGAWPDRFNYDVVMKKYVKALLKGNLAAFYQELMLRIMNEEDRLITDAEIKWWEKDKVNLDNCHFFMTTDFATTEKEYSDYNVIMIWAVDNYRNYYLVDGIRKRQTMDVTIAQIFAYAKRYDLMGVGLEISGQQGGFLSLLRQQMLTEDTWFPIAMHVGTNTEGIKSVANKFSRFLNAVNLFKLGQIHLPEHLKGTELVSGFVTELTMATKQGFKSKHDDTLDAFSMLESMYIWEPGEATPESIIKNEAEAKLKQQALKDYDPNDPFANHTTSEEAFLYDEQEGGFDSYTY